jgi:hypothetical protein
LKTIAALAVVISLSVGAHAQAGTEEYRGTLKGDQMKTYPVSVAANQTLTVSLKTKSGSVYFNVTPAGAKEAIWSGEVQGGSKFEQKFEQAANFRIDVFQLKADAQRGGQAPFTLTVSTEP